MSTTSIPSGTSNKTVDISNYITDTSNYLYQVFIMSTNDGTNYGIPITATVDIMSRKVIFARASGEEDTQTITINYVIAKFLI